MITANIRFLDSHASVDIPCSNSKILNNLGRIGVLINPEYIMLNNSRMVKVQLVPVSSMGEDVISLINPTDTLGKLNRLCTAIDSLDATDCEVLQEAIQGNKLKSFDHILEIIERLMEKNKRINRVLSFRGSFNSL